MWDPLTKENRPPRAPHAYVEPLNEEEHASLSVCLELSKFPVGVPRGTHLRSRAPLVRCGTDNTHTFRYMHDALDAADNEHLPC